MNEEREKSIKETSEHIEKVGDNIGIVQSLLETRKELHDRSKLKGPELDIYAYYGPKLKDTEYMSDEYKKHLKEMKPGLDHHYFHNRHHPEFYKNGIKDMSMIDILEMLSDWKASVERTKDGDIFKSLEINAKRFNINPELLKIMKNTMIEMMPFSIVVKDYDNEIVLVEWGNSFEQLYEKIDLFNIKDRDILHVVRQFIDFEYICNKKPDYTMKHFLEKSISYIDDNFEQKEVLIIFRKTID